MVMRRRTKQGLVVIAMVLVATFTFHITSANAMSRDGGLTCSWIGALFRWCTTGR